MMSLKFCSIPETLFSDFLYLTRPLEQGKIYTISIYKVVDFSFG